MFVQFTGPDEKVVAVVFGCPQDAATWPNQGEVGLDDPRYLAFMEKNGRPDGVMQ